MLAAGASVGRYVIKRKLAEGGMAEIFLASAVGPEGFSKDVVIKKIRSFLASDAQFVQMFIAEARLASKLNHANVVQIFDFGKHDDSYYLAMEYVRGASLSDLRKQCREMALPFPPTLAAEIGAQVARGLHYAHSLTENGQKLGVVHRDVTPHNVLLSIDGAVKLTDFGIAKAQSTHTAPGMLKGKFAYMSPEQSRGDRVDARTDLFALGIVLWELLTGGRLFEGESDLAVLRAVQETLIAPPSRINPDVPQELSDIVMKCLARPLEERFQTAFELDRALANFVLRASKSVEDSSVAHFLGQVYREDTTSPEADQRQLATPGDTLPPDDDFGLGNTVAKLGSNTITATPTPMGAPPSRAPVRTEPMGAAAAKPRTEQMPALQRRPSSRRFDPIQVEEASSVVVRPSLQLPKVGEETLPPASQTESVPGYSAPSQPSGSITEKGSEPAAELAPGARSNGTLWLLLGGLVALGVVLGAGVMLWQGRQEAASAQLAPSEPSPPVVKAEPAPVAKVEPPPIAVDAEPTTPVEAPVVDAGVEVDAGPSEPTQVVEAPKPAEPKAAPRKVGTLVIKAVPFATVTLQGRTLEITGMKSLPVTAGTFEVTLKHPRKTVKEKVTVPANGTANLTFSAD